MPAPDRAVAIQTMLQDLHREAAETHEACTIRRAQLVLTAGLTHDWKIRDTDEAFLRDHAYDLALFLLKFREQCDVLRKDRDDMLARLHEAGILP